MERLKTWHIIVAILATLAAGLWFLNGQWNQQKAVAEVRFAASSNKEMYLKITLDRYCQKYGYNAYPCPSGRFSPEDRKMFQQYEKWYHYEQERIRKMFGG